MDIQNLLKKSGKNPQSILKIVLVFSFILLVMWLFLVSKMDTSSVASQQPDRTEEVNERTIGLHQSLKKAGGDSTTTTKGTPQVAQAEEEPELFQNAFVTFLVMVGLLGGIWLWAKRKENGPKKIKKSREIDTHQLTESSQLKFLEINEEVWVVGVSEKGLDVLHRYERSEWKEGTFDAQKNQEVVASKAKQKEGNMDFKSLLKVVSN